MLILKKKKKKNQQTTKKNRRNYSIGKELSKSMTDDAFYLNIWCFKTTVIQNYYSFIVLHTQSVKRNICYCAVLRITQLERYTVRLKKLCLYQYSCLLVFLFFFLFDLIIYVPSTIFQLNRDGSFWIEPVLS